MCIINIIWNLWKYLNFFISINFWNRSFLSHFVYFWLFLIDSTITYDWKNCFDHLSMLKIYWSALSTNFILAAEVSMLVSTTILPLSPSASPIYFPGIGVCTGAKFSFKILIWCSSRMMMFPFLRTLIKFGVWKVVPLVMSGFIAQLKKLSVLAL